MQSRCVRLTRLRRLWRAGLTAASVAVFALWAAAAAAEPALWVAQSRDATVYLFGTIHVERPGETWRSPALAKAIGQSQELWLEIDNPGDPKIAEIVKTYGLTRTPLSSLLSAADQAQLQKLCVKLHVDPGSLEQMRPWLASIRLEFAALSAEGYSADSGVDLSLDRQFSGDGRPVKAFETAAQQIKLLATAPDSVQIAMLHDTLSESADAHTQITAMFKAWEAGDEKALQALLLEDAKTTSPELYKMLFVDRNRAFAEKIGDLLHRRGVFFVAIGAGHLTGPDSVQTFLRRQGVHITRKDPVH